LKKDLLDIEIKNATLEAKIGDIVGPVMTPLGYVILKIDDIKNDELKATKILVKFKTYQTTLDDAEYEKNRFRETLEENKYSTASFDLALKAIGKNAKVHAAIPKVDYTEDFGRIFGLSRFLFENKQGTVSPVMSTKKGYIFIRIKDIEAERSRTKDELKDAIVLRVKREKQIEEAYSAISKVSIQDTLAFKDILKSNDKFEAGITPKIAKNDFIPKIGKDDDFTQKAFSIEKNKISGAFKGKQGAYIIYVLDRDEFNKETFDKEKDAIRVNLEREAGMRAVQEWITAIKDKAKIEDYRSLYYSR